MNKKTKPGRPKAKGPTPIFPIRLSAEDRVILQAAADKLSLDLASFVRMAAKEKATGVLK